MEKNKRVTVIAEGQEKIVTWRFVDSTLQIDQSVEHPDIRHDALLVNLPGVRKTALTLVTHKSYSAKTANVPVASREGEWVFIRGTDIGYNYDTKDSDLQGYIDTHEFRIRALQAVLDFREKEREEQKRVEQEAHNTRVKTLAEIIEKAEDSLTEEYSGDTYAIAQYLISSGKVTINEDH